MFAEFYVLGISVYLLSLAVSWVLSESVTEAAINNGISIGFLLMVVGVIIWFWEILA